MGLLDFEDQFTSYGKYHRNKTNKILHVFCIPLICVTSLIWMAYIPAVHVVGIVSLKVPYIVAAAYALYYLLLDPVAGALYAPLLLSMACLAIKCQSQFTEQAALYAAAIHVLAWMLQFVGHGIFEKRAPAFLDGLVKTFLFAPLFAFLEILFLLGYRPAFQTRTAERIQALVDKEKPSKK